MARKSAPTSHSPSDADGNGDDFSTIIGQSSIMRELLHEIEIVSRTDASVLIEGETGVGKTLMARTLHRQGPRAEGPFIALNAASLPEGLFESELFGHVKGAFSGAHDHHKGLARAADGGTLFIDEVGELSLGSQAKLLGLLDEREVRPVGGLRSTRSDFRLISATNKDLPALVRERAFRRDLFYRLRVVSLRIPNLKERAEDLPLLADHFLRHYCHKYGKKLGGLSPQALDSLRRHNWKGNVRELKNEIERAVILTPPDQEIQTSVFSLAAEPASQHSRVPTSTLKRSRQQAESRLIRETLVNHRWNVSAAARVLGISRVGLTRKLKRLGIYRPGQEPEDLGSDPTN